MPTASIRPNNLFFFVSVAVAALLLVMTIMSRLNQA